MADSDKELWGGAIRFKEDEEHHKARVQLEEI